MLSIPLWKEKTSEMRLVDSLTKALKMKLLVTKKLLSWSTNI
jgi:hypothetical protein